MDGATNSLIPDWVARSLSHAVFQPLPFMGPCAWCGARISLFGEAVVDLANGYAHKTCMDKAERFALKSSIRHRTNPRTGYFPGWRTP